MYHDNNNLSRAYSAYNYSTARIAKGDFIRMKEISLTYDFPKKLISKLKLKPLRKISGDQPLPDLRGQETQRPGSGVLQHRRCRGTGLPASSR